METTVYKNVKGNMNLSYHRLDIIGIGFLHHLLDVFSIMTYQF